MQGEHFQHETAYMYIYDSPVHVSDKFIHYFPTSPFCFVTFKWTASELEG